jgi:hypothetical protein
LNLPDQLILHRPPTPAPVFEELRSSGASCTFLAINGARLTADADQTYAFVAALYEANQFRFDKLVPWLRSHVTQEEPHRS